MTEFVEECRREWKRLRVPDAAANEMAADLAADLKEAEDDGTPAEELLGNEAFDPRAFAMRWARERGLIHSSARERFPRPRVIAAIAVAVLALVGGAVAAAVLLTSSDSKTGTAEGTRTGAAPVTTTFATTAPDLIGLTQAEATARAQAAGLTLQVKYVNSEQSNSGVVLGQSPTAGSNVSRGATLSLMVGR